MVQSASTKDYCVQISWFCILKDKNFLWTCSFSATNMTDFVSPSLKLHNQYCNSACQFSRQITIGVFLFFSIFILFFSDLCLKNKNSKHETTVKWKTVNPEFHEQFVYLTSSAELPKQSLHITVWDRGKNRPDKYAGKLFSFYTAVMI